MKKIHEGLIFDYDEKADVLYITDPELNERPTGEMTDEGVIVRWNNKKKICGLTVLDFMKRVKGGEKIQTHLHVAFQPA